MTGWAIVILFTHLYTPTQLPTLFIDKAMCEVARENTETVMRRKGLRGVVMCAQVAVPPPSMMVMPNAFAAGDEKK